MMLGAGDDVADPLWNDDTMRSLAAALVQAYADGVPIAPFAGRLPDAEAAYAVQEFATEDAVARGRRIVGRKIGLTSPAVQRAAGVDRPDYGVLFGDMEFGDGCELPSERLIQPRIEAEIVFVLERDLVEERPTFTDVHKSIGYAVAAIEVVDSRVRDWRIGVLESIADNASAGVYVLGGTKWGMAGLDLSLCGMRLDTRGRTVSTGCGAACLGHPLNAVVWLARMMAHVGRPLRAGDVVLSGALGPMAAVEFGEEYTATIAGLGSVSTAFAKRSRE